MDYTHRIEEQRIALGHRPRTLHGWIFWYRHWAPYAGLRRQLATAIGWIVAFVIMAGVIGGSWLVGLAIERALGLDTRWTWGTPAVVALLCVLLVLLLRRDR